MISSTQQIDLSLHLSHQIKIAYLGREFKNLIKDLSFHFTVIANDDLESFERYINEQTLLSLPDILLLEADEDEKWLEFVKKTKKNPLLQGLIIVAVSAQARKEWKKKALALKLHDFYVQPVDNDLLMERLNFLVKFKLIKPQLSQLSQQVDVSYRMPLYKRLFDIVAAGAALLLLSPFFLLIAAAIRVESKGPVVYKSKRVGTGYKIFDFYKFRSMRPDADKILNQLSSKNQYAADGKSAFVKIKDDPRITKVGSFIRNTSIDELPQLFNVLKGDMSLVGNRPLPLYEAEMLTSNEWTMRFLGPAGLTGLWQISKRGKEDMSERERKKLDNFYAQKYSFWLDLKIILKTIPALLQKEKV